MTQNKENKIYDILSEYCNVEVNIDKTVYPKIAKQIGLEYSGPNTFDGNTECWYQPTLDDAKKFAELLSQETYIVF